MSVPLISIICLGNNWSFAASEKKTEHTDKRVVKAAFASGMNGFVPKPVDIGYLNQVMEENLKKE